MGNENSNTNVVVIQSSPTRCSSDGFALADENPRCSVIVAARCELLVRALKGTTMRCPRFLLVLLLIPAPALAQQCPPDQEYKPVQVAPGKFVLRCEHNVPGSGYPSPKRLQGAAGTTVAGVKIGYHDIETPLAGHIDHLQVTIQNSVPDGQLIEGPTRVTSGQPYWTELKGVVTRGKGQNPDEFYLTGLRHGSGEWQKVGLYIIIK